MLIGSGSEDPACWLITEESDAESLVGSGSEVGSKVQQYYL